jgi:hypothetical protein
MEHIDTDKKRTQIWDPSNKHADIIVYNSDITG